MLTARTKPKRGQLNGKCLVFGKQAYSSSYKNIQVLDVRLHPRYSLDGAGSLEIIREALKGKLSYIPSQLQLHGHSSIALPDSPQAIGRYDRAILDQYPP